MRNRIFILKIGSRCVVTLFLIIFFFCLSLATYAQQATGEGMIARRLAQAPDTVFRSTSSFSNFLLSEFDAEKEILTAIYTWIGKSVSYDVENMYNSEFEENPQRLIEKTFHTRKAVCQGYCELFNALCRQCGIQSFVVHGYTKQEGEVKNTGHAWIVVTSDKNWYCIDPTWGAGYLQDGRFVRSFTYEYFMISPENFITSHMPFDLMWQCLYHPVSIEDFYYGEIQKSSDNELFDYADSISTYEKLPLIQQYEITIRRIQQNGVRNTLIRDYALFIKQTIENDRITKTYEYQSKVVERLNDAAEHFNIAANLFNQYISYFNRQFRPTLPDAGIKQMIDTCDSQIKSAKWLVDLVDPYDEKIRQNVDQVKSVIRELQLNIEKQKEFVKRYLETKKGYRPFLFSRHGHF
jgi:transglutaminase/protease-like cytokinesis protein 3